VPRPGPRQEQVAVRLDAETLAALDAYVERRHASAYMVGRESEAPTRSDVLRAALTEWLRRNA
jgi:hypothetical protein